MQIIWLVHLVFLVLYAAVAWIADQQPREAVGFFLSPWFALAFTTPTALVAVLIGPALRGRMRWSGAMLLRWALAEGPALTGILTFLAGGSWWTFALRSTVSVVLLLWLFPSADGRSSWPVRARPS